MSIRLLTGNEALALGAVHAGARVITGYPGTPSTGALASLLTADLDDVHVEWSTNEKVAFEIAAGAAWAGQRALCTMKMSGLNVAYDSIISIAYSGCVGGLVIYVADDPGVSAGMAEQDSRGFALMSDMPMLEPTSVAEAYTLTQTAFEISERAGTPVFVRLVTALSNSTAPVDVADAPQIEPRREPQLLHDIDTFTKAGAAICMAQHRDLIARLEQAGALIDEMGVNALDLAAQLGGLGIVAAGVCAAYLEEGFEIAAGYGFDPQAVSVLRVRGVHPFPAAKVRALLEHVERVLVLEELEPYLERALVVEAHGAGYVGKIVGKLDGTFERIGEYGVRQVVEGIAAALDLVVPEDLFAGARAEDLAAARPITVCAGCPHRGTYMAINKALKNLKYKQGQVMVTGDIGCTILGMNPPFHTVWNEVSMGASVSLAQGYVQAGIETPVIATIGDSTFFHGGIPGLVNAVQHQTPMTLIIMDNGWTSMTGMQVNPGTDEAFQPGNRRVDIAAIVPALGVEQFFVIDPFDFEAATDTIQHALTLPGVKVILARQECAIQAQRRGLRVQKVTVDPEACRFCKTCVRVTGCPALELGDNVMTIDPALCYGCGLCAAVCPFDAIRKEPLA
ncbi:MAG: indolepyruvate ferredoxin oxidoreductase subunit alpha [Anaerolineae bacterium]|nr:indolepyruvate ferredoxin oxidoreductase subunit alpha [Anaerolineae bacterium]